MRFGLIGYGLWGRHHADAITRAPGASLVAIACRSAETEAAARHDHPGVAVYRDYRELLARADVDAVSVVVPNHLHAEIGVAALGAGKDVLLEKPMACTTDECDRLIEAARASGRVLSIGHELRLSSQWGRIKALIDAGEVGEPLYAHASLFRFPYRGGAERWRYARDRVGSWILEEPVHAFDTLLWYFEPCGDPTSLLAVGNGRGGEPGMDHDFTCVVRFPRGRYAVVTESLAGFEYHQLFELVGETGAIRTWWSGTLDRTLTPTFEVKVQRGGGSPVETLALAPSGELFELREQLARTVTAFRERRPLVAGDDARKRVLMCLEAERSLREGREIPLRF